MNYRHSPKSQYFRDYHRFFLSLTSCQSNTDAINNSIVRRPQSKNCLITVNCKHFQRNLFAVIQTKVFKWFKETYLGHQQKWFGVIFFGLPKVIILQGEKAYIIMGNENDMMTACHNTWLSFVCWKLWLNKNVRLVR